MATLTDQDFIWIQGWIMVHPSVKLFFKTKNYSKSVWKNAFQALENYMVNAYLNTPTEAIKTAIIGITGSLTTLESFNFYDAWNAWKIYTRGSG